MQIYFRKSQFTPQSTIFIYDSPIKKHKSDILNNSFTLSRLAYCISIIYINNIIKNQI